MNEANYGKCRDLSVIWEFSKMYIDMQPVVERMKPEESLEDFVG